MHKQFLLTALAQAWRGRGSCAPNPSVGALAVIDDVIVAQAWHHGAGKSHAERLLIEESPGALQGATLYVTLEPCNHWGRTPPCVDAIIDSGIARVVYGYSDPNPIVKSNNTTAILNQHGIEVIHYPLSEIDEFYHSYQQWVLTGYPQVRVKIAQSFDGKIAGVCAARVFLSNELCHEYTHTKRLQHDIILTTARTVNNDDPLLNVRLGEEAIVKPVAIIDRRLQLSPKAKILHTMAPIHIYYDANLRLDAPLKGVSYHAIPALNNRLDLQVLLKHLGALGYHDVWVEAGGELFNSLHLAHLVNRTDIYLVPKILGQDAVTAYPGSDIFQNAHSITWHAMGNNMIASLRWKQV